MKQPFDRFVGGAYSGRSKAVTAEDLVNLYYEPAELPGGKGQAGLYGRPGLSVFVQGLDAPLRALFAENGQVFAIGGATYYEIQQTGPFTGVGVVRGAVALDGGRATICSNGDGAFQNAICSGGFGYIHNRTTNAFTLIGAASFLPQVTSVTFVDGYFIWLARNQNKFQLSKLEDGLTYSGLDVAQRSTASDRLEDIIADHEELILGGSQTSEIWKNTGASSFPFEPMGGTFIEQGMVRQTLQKFDNTVAFLSKNARGGGQVFRLEGYQPKRISNHAVEYNLSTYATLDDAEAFVEEYLGHTFYVLNFPTAMKTWVYDAALPAPLGWHRREWHNAATNQAEHARPRVHAYAFQQHLVGDRALGTIYTQSLTTYSDNGVPIRSRRRAPHLTSAKVRSFYDWFELDCQVGDGLADPTLTPVVTLRYSDDGGNTFKGDRTMSLGLAGQYDTRPRWSQLGSGRDRVFEIEISDAVPRAIAAAYVDSHPGAF